MSIVPFCLPQWVTSERLPRTPDLTYLDLVVNATVYLAMGQALFSIGCKGALRWGADTEIVTQVELGFGGVMSLFVLTMLCKVYSAWHTRQVVEHGFEWLMESKNPAIKLMGGCCFYIPLVDGEVQNDKR